MGIQIKVSNEVWKILHNSKIRGESFDAVLRRKYLKLKPLKKIKR